jgi:hypothetical protein
MRTTRTLLFLLIGAVLLSPIRAQKKLMAAEAKEHFGENATVCGQVVSTVGGTRIQQKGSLHSLTWTNHTRIKSSLL